MLMHLVTMVCITEGTHPFIQSACAENPPGRLDEYMSDERRHVAGFLPETG